MRKITNEELGRPSAGEFARMEKMPVAVVLDNVRSMQNVGAFFRTADAFAVERIALCGITATPPNREIHKTALGAELTVAWDYFAATTDCIAALRAQGYLIYVVEQVEGAVMLDEFRPRPGQKYALVFGCGGNRSKLRRYGMGEICAKMADFSILTEDNNRFEKVEDILADIRVGMNKGNPDAKFVEIPDRLDALHYAVDHAQEGDLIAVIGKGHETYRDREGVKTPFLERELLEEYAQQIGLE